MQGIIFDLDSTLTDSLGAIASTRLGLLKSLASIPRVDRNRIEEHFRQAMTADIHDEQILDTLDSGCFHACASDVAHSALARIRLDYQKALSDRTCLLSETESTLRDLAGAGVHLVIWTNKRRRSVIPQADRLGLWQLISAIYCRPDLTDGAAEPATPPGLTVLPEALKKPSPKGLSCILRAEGLDPERALLVGNNLRSDGGSTVGTGVGFVLVDFGVPSAATERILYRLTNNDRLSYRRVRHRMEDGTAATLAPVAVLRHSLRELLALGANAPCSA